jgi:hypothetical protein
MRVYLPIPFYIIPSDGIKYCKGSFGEAIEQLALFKFDDKPIFLYPFTESIIGMHIHFLKTYAFMCNKKNDVKTDMHTVVKNAIHEIFTTNERFNAAMKEEEKKAKIIRKVMGYSSVLRLIQIYNHWISAADDSLVAIDNKIDDAFLIRAIHTLNKYDEEIETSKTYAINIKGAPYFISYSDTKS